MSGDRETVPNQCGGVVYLGSVHPPHTWQWPGGPVYYCDGGRR